MYSSHRAIFFLEEMKLWVQLFSKKCKISTALGLSAGEQATVLESKDGNNQEQSVSILRFTNSYLKNRASSSVFPEFKGAIFSALASKIALV